MGLIAYQIVWLVLEALSVMFRFLLDRNRMETARLRLIQSVLVITTPLDVRRHEVTGLHQLAWQTVTALVFAIPIVVSVLAIADLTNAIPALILKPQTERLLPNMSQGTLGKLAFEVAMTVVQVWLYGKLYALVQLIGRNQSEATAAILALEGGARDPAPRRAEPQPLGVGVGGTTPASA